MLNRIAVSLSVWCNRNVSSTGQLGKWNRIENNQAMKSKCNDPTDRNTIFFKSISLQNITTLIFPSIPNSLIEYLLEIFL